MWDKWNVVCSTNARDRVQLHILVVLPDQAEEAVLAEEEPLQRLPRPLLLRDLGPVPGVPRAPAPGLRPDHRVAGEHGEEGAGGNHATRRPGRDEPLNGVKFAKK